MERTLAEVSDGADQLQNAVIRPRRQMQLLHGGLQEPLSRGVGFAEVAHFGGAHLGVAGQFRSGETLELSLSRCLRTRANSGRVFGVAFIGQLLVIDAGDFDVHVNVVDERAGHWCVFGSVGWAGRYNCTL